MKSKIMSYCCMNKLCGWKERTHKIRDGVKCPECKGPVTVGVDWYFSENGKQPVPGSKVEG